MVQQELELPAGFESPEDYVEALVSFVERFQWLYELHVVDFFSLQRWNLLDPEWQAALIKDCDQPDWFEKIIQIPSFDGIIPPEWPDSLKEYIQSAKALILPRRVAKEPLQNRIKCGKDLLFGMTKKKIHEVELMSTLIHDVAQERGISHVLDLGSGQGYLSRALAFQHDMDVLAVDMSEIQTRGAEKFDRRAIRAAERKNKSKVEPMKFKKLQHVTEMITPENVSSVLTRWGSSHGGDEKKAEPWLICGLHTCGDLSPMIMRLFVESDRQIASLVNVGCCYHYLADGFPMSNPLKKRGYRLNTTARVLACQSPWQWIYERESSQKSFEQHFSRALLQQIMIEKGLASTSAPPALGKRINKRFDFGEYVQTALKKFGIVPDAISPEEATMYYARYKNEYRGDVQITALWTLRALLAPVLESLILMDRWFYLKGAINKIRSNNDRPSAAGVWMWPLFDPYESPRNVVFVASK